MCWSLFRKYQRDGSTVKKIVSFYKHSSHLQFSLRACCFEERLEGKLRIKCFLAEEEERRKKKKARRVSLFFQWFYSYFFQMEFEKGSFIFPNLLGGAPASHQIDRSQAW